MQLGKKEVHLKFSRPFVAFSLCTWCPKIIVFVIVSEGSTKKGFLSWPLPFCALQMPIAKLKTLSSIRHCDHHHHVGGVNRAMGELYKLQYVEDHRYNHHVIKSTSSSWRCEQSYVTFSGRVSCLSNKRRVPLPVSFRLCTELASQKTHEKY